MLYIFKFPRQFHFISTPTSTPTMSVFLPGKILPWLWSVEEGQHCIHGEWWWITFLHCACACLVTDVMVVWKMCNIPGLVRMKETRNKVDVTLWFIYDTTLHVVIETSGCVVTDPTVYFWVLERWVCDAERKGNWKRGTDGVWDEMRLVVILSRAWWDRPVLLFVYVRNGQHCSGAVSYCISEAKDNKMPQNLLSTCNPCHWGRSFSSDKIICCCFPFCLGSLIFFEMSTVSQTAYKTFPNLIL